MELVIQVTIKNVYGEERIYPACPRAEAFAALLGQKTLTRSDIVGIKRIGFTVTVVPAGPVTL